MTVKSSEEKRERDELKWKSIFLPLTFLISSSDGRNSLGDVQSDFTTRRVRQASIRLTQCHVLGALAIDAQNRIAELQTGSLRTGVLFDLFRKRACKQSQDEDYIWLGEKLAICAQWRDNIYMKDGNRHEKVSTAGDAESQQLTDIRNFVIVVVVVVRRDGIDAQILIIC